MKGSPSQQGTQDSWGSCKTTMGTARELTRIRTTWRIERLSKRGQVGGQKWERLDRAAARGRGRTVGTMADVVGKAPQSIIGWSALPWKKEFAGK